MKTRDCFNCYGDGKVETYGEDDETVVGEEDCYLCKGSGKVEDVCYCSAFCACECACGYDDGNGNECHCWD